MSSVLTILIMSAALGAAAFCIGMLPLFFAFSRTHLEYLTTVGAGLLLGAALGIIIPEGVETLIASGSTEPSRKIALSLLLGFAFMLVVEQLVSGHEGHSHGRLKRSPLPVTDAHPLSLRSTRVENGGADGNPHEADSANEELDVSLAELEEAEGPRAVVDDESEQPMLGRRSGSRAAAGVAKGRERAFSMTLGLVVHSLADGLALGASALAGEGSGEGGGGNSQLSLVVFLAILVHKAPTALALSMSLMASLTPSECRRHLAAFSAATPLGALAVFMFLKLLGGTFEGDWTGIALLLSGGTFLYVATVLAPVSKPETRSPASPELNEKLRVGLILLGMFIPLLISLFTGLEH